jgi:hypothetical protein
MNFRSHRVLAVGGASVALAASSLGLATTASATAASGTHHVKHGETVLSLDSSAVTALSNAGYTVKVSGRTVKSGDAVASPVSSGRVKASDYTGTFKQTGAMSVSKNGVTVTISKPTAHLGAGEERATVSGKGSGYAALTIGHPQASTYSQTDALFSSYKVSWSNRMARYLDNKFSTSLFKHYQTVGTATTSLNLRK